jgi:asparagine synthase (glutamine-hydrolysing)
LGNARLSIIDLAGGDQPITNEDGTSWIVFNGEIFNFPELRLELITRGHHFSTHTDTEVILHLYEEYGPECLNYLNGQFAIAIWQVKEQRLFLARDRLGIRPLFYTIQNGRLSFGSEIKCLLACQGMRAEIDPVAVSQVFTYWAPLTPRTIFKEIQELAPGHYLVAEGGKIETRAYWEMRMEVEGPERTVDEYLEEFESLLVEATRIRLRADVPVGAYLSGGLDSSTLAAIIRNDSHIPLDTFSIAFSDPEFDESPFQRQMAAFLGTQHQVVYARYTDIAQIFPQVIWHAEAPILRTAPAPMYLLSKLVRENGYKVVITGEGADEFLGGYDIYKEAAIRRFWARQPESKLRPQLLTRLYPDIQAMPGSVAYLASFFKEGLELTSAPDYSHSIRWRNTRRGQRFFSEDLRQAVEAQEAAAGPPIRYPAGFGNWEPLGQAQWLESTILLPQYLLSSQGDRMALAHSVEGRYPFLDYRVVEFCNRLPPSVKLRGLTEKYLLKKLARKWLPGDIWQRRKRPYRAPIHRSFFNAASPEWIAELLSPGWLLRAGLFNPECVSQLVQKLQAGRRLGETDDMALAGILSSQLVYQQFVHDFQAPPRISAGEIHRNYLRENHEL